MPLNNAAMPSPPNASPRRAGFVAIAPIAVALVVPVLPGPSAAQPGPGPRLTPRDWPAWLAQPRAALGARAATPRELRWTWAAVEPGTDGSLAACVRGRRNPPGCWAGVPTQGMLRYRGVYPGVALTVENRRNALAYRFDIAPYGHAHDIRMRYPGTDALSVEDGGRALRMRVGGRDLRESGLFCYQDMADSRREVSCRYRITVGPDGVHEIALDIGAHDRGRRLVVDPTIAWSSYLGGGANDQGNDLVVDGDRNVYVVGRTASANFPTVGGFDTTRDGSLDAFVAKVDPAGARVEWSSYLGGEGDDESTGVAVDGSGNVYVVGTTLSSDFPTTGGIDPSLGGAVDAFMAKVDPSGASLLWSSYLGGEGEDRGRSVAVDGSGNVYFVGSTSSSDFPSTGGFDTSLGGGVDAFVTKVDPAGSTLAWSSYLGGADDDFGTSAAIDDLGDVYVVGVTSSVNFPATGGFDATLGGSADAFVAKVDAAGSGVAWSSYLGGNRYDEGHAVAVDADGNAYVTGYTASSDFPLLGAFDADVDVAGDAFVTKVDASGSSLAWSSYLGGSNYDEGGFDVAVDSGGNAYVTGSTFSSDFPLVAAFDTEYDVAGDAFVTKVDASGSILAWSSYMGGSDSDAGSAIAVGDGDDVYVTGYTFSSDYPTAGGFDVALDGTLDSFVTQILSACGNDICDTAETPCNCPADCGEDSCPNGCCGPTETSCDCVADCGSSCGDGCCNGPEDACDCPEDCEAECGDGCCSGDEDCVSCSSDCECPEPSPDMMPDTGAPDADAGGSVDGPEPDTGSNTTADSEGCGCELGRAPGERVASLFALLWLLGACGRRLRTRSRSRG